MGLCALAFLALRGDLISVFLNATTPEADRALILSLGAQIMVAAAVFQVFDAVAITVSAALRGAGDTIWPGVAALVSSWVCIVGLGHLLLWLRPELGGLAAWIGAAGYIIALGVVLLLRFMAGKWREIRLVDDDPIRQLPPDEVLPPGPNPEVG
jgi:MATE family multidrug resistance protein